MRWGRTGASPPESACRQEDGIPNQPLRLVTSLVMVYQLSAAQAAATASRPAANAMSTLRAMLRSGSWRGTSVRMPLLRTAVCLSLGPSADRIAVLAYARLFN
jgi:hypothetical protein